MKTTKFFLFFLLSVLVVVLVESTSKQNGFDYTTWISDQYNSSLSDQSLASMLQTGANHVAILITWYQATLNSTSIQPYEGSSPTLESVAHAAQTAHALGMSVVLKPHVDCLCGTWRAQIGTQFTSEAQWTEWFGNYTAYLTLIAQFAEANNVSMIVIGTEMIGTSAREQDWRTVIAAIRGLYGGHLTYASNWGMEPFQVQFWDALDFIGVDAYYPMSLFPNPSLDVILAHWEPIKTNLTALLPLWNKSIIFTEIGYRSFYLAAVEPAEYNSNGAPDLETQYLLFQGFFESVYMEDWFAGVYWWSWIPDPMAGGRCDDGFSPQRKPTIQIIQQYYNANSYNASGIRSSPSKPREDLAHMAKIQSKHVSIVPLLIYEDGSLNNGWQSWSYNGDYSPCGDQQDPYPGHQCSFAATNVQPSGSGAVSLYNGAASQLVSEYSNITFNALFTNSTSDICISVCSCENCPDCTLEVLSLNEFFSSSLNCSVPVSPQWSGSFVSVSLLDLGIVSPETPLVRLNVANCGSGNINFFLDNIMLQ